MICWHCQQPACGCCRFCGRAVCSDHVSFRAYPLAVWRGGPERKPRVLAVEDALYCGACTPRTEPLDLPELDQ